MLSEGGGYERLLQEMRVGDVACRYAHARSNAGLIQMRHVPIVRRSVGRDGTETRVTVDDQSREGREERPLALSILFCPASIHCRTARAAGSIAGTASRISGIQGERPSPSALPSPPPFCPPCTAHRCLPTPRPAGSRPSPSGERTTPRHRVVSLGTGRGRPAAPSRRDTWLQPNRHKQALLQGSRTTTEQALDRIFS